MKLMLIIISNEDTQDVTKGLLKEKFYVTKLATTGGLLHGGNTTLLLGVADEEVNRVKEIVSVYAKTRKKKVTTGEPGDLNLFSFYQLTFRLKEQLFLLSMLMNITSCNYGAFSMLFFIIFKNVCVFKKISYLIEILKILVYN